MKTFRKLFYSMLAMSILLLLIGYRFLQFRVMDLTMGRDGHAIQLRNMFKDTRTEQGESEEMLLVSKTDYNFSDITHSPNSNLSHKVLIVDTNTQKSMDILLYPIMTFEDAVMEQYKHFKTFSSQKQLDFKQVDPLALSKIMKFKFTIQGVQICNQMTYRILQITETMKNGVTTEGGSGFLVKSSSHYLTVCPVIDHFNGSYSVMCPFYGPCSNISILLKHLQFSGFVGPTRVIERTIWKQDNICISPKDIPYKDFMTTFNSTGNLQTEDQELKDYLGTLAKPRGDLTGELGHWLQYKNRWRWIGTNGEVLPFERNKTLCTCYQKFKHVHLIGSSHQQFNTQCLSTLCQTSNILNDMFNQRFSPDIIKSFNETLASVRSDSSNPYAFIIQFGSWEMSKLAYQNDVITQHIPNFASHIQELYASKRQEYPHVKLLVMSAPALADIDKMGRRIVNRNNWISAVFAKTLRHHMESINVDFLDEFAFTLPLNTDCWCCPRRPSHHFAFFNKTTHTCIGDVGKAFMALFTLNVCPDIKV